jgi:hypothetical protein
MAGQFLSDASNFEATQFDTKIPSLSDEADIVEAFKLYHYGLDNYTGGQSPASDSIHGHLVSIDNRVTSLETVPSVTLSGTENQIEVSASVGNVVIGFPNNLVIDENLTINGSLFVSGSTTFVNTQSVSVTDPMLLLASNNDANAVDIGLVGRYVESSTTLYTGLVKDDSDSTWKFFSGTSASPTTQLNFTGVTFDNLKAGSIELTGGITTTSESDIRYTFNEETSNYTITMSDIGKIIEMNVDSSNIVSVPLNSTVSFPIGCQVVILQTGSGQTTLTGVGGVTVNGSPGLKLRGQWASATLVKRQENAWVAIGDLVN